MRGSHAPRDCRAPQDRPGPQGSLALRGRRRTPRRLVSVVAALFGLVLLLAAPASAAPQIPGVPDCKDAPTAQMPGTGLAGFLDEGPSTPPKPLDPFTADPRTSVYEQYGYAGLSWTTYDLGCGGGMRDMNASIDTTVGNAFLSAAAWNIAATNGLHNKVSQPAQYMAPLDDVVTAVTQRLHDAIWTPWGGIALFGVAALLLFYSTSGRLSAVTSAAAWALLVLAVVAGLAQYPSRVASFFDEAVTGSIAKVNASTAGLSTLPASSDPVRAQGALLVDRIAYDAWVRGEFGSSDSPAAKTWGPDLYKASAFTWAEAEKAKDPAEGKKIAERKAENWKKVTAQIQDKDPVAYAYVQGKAGGRAGTGLMAFLGAMFTALFRLAADIFVFAGLVMVRLLVMFFPAVAVIGVMAPMAAVVRRVANIGGAAIVNVVAFSAGSAIHTTVISAILSRATDVGMGLLALVLCLVVTLAAFVLLYPLLTFSSILGQSGSGHRLLRKAGGTAVNYAVGRKAVEDGNKDASEDQARESASPSPASAGRTRGHAMPAEAFGRPSPALGARPHGERALAASPAASMAELEPARVAPAVASADSRAEWVVVDRPALPAADRARPDPAYDLAGAHEPRHPAYPLASPPEPTRTGAAVGAGSPSPAHALGSGPAVAGVVVDRVPAGVIEVESLVVHDSQTEVRRDGIGPRIYDPATKQSVLTSARLAEEGPDR